MILPNFIVAGAPRCGTTSLHYYLRQHAQVCMSAIKEPNFFLFGSGGKAYIAEQPIVRKSVRDLSAYSGLFHPTDTSRAIGEASPLYLYSQPSAAQILAVCGLIRIVCVLRRPADRAWSHFLYAFSDIAEGERAAAFAELVDAEMRGGTGYEPYRTRTHLLRLGRYTEQVRRYQDTFGPDNVLVLLTEDLAVDPSAALASVCRFIDVDPSQELALEQRYNTSGTSAAKSWPMVRRLQRRFQPALKVLLPPRVAGRLAAARVTRSDGGPAASPTLDPIVAARIAEWCADDVEALATVLGRDLSDWQDHPAG